MAAVYKLEGRGGFRGWQWYVLLLLLKLWLKLVWKGVNVICTGFSLWMGLSLFRLR
jgi:hypothetical protein